MHRPSNPVLQILILLLPCYLISGSISSATYKVEILAKLECNLIGGLLRYVERQQNYSKEILPAVQSFVDNKLSVAPSDGEAVGHPIKAFHALRRLARDWRNIAGLVFNNSAEDSATKEFQILFRKAEFEISRWPTEEDVDGAMTGLLHVWSVYQLDADDVIAGIMFGMPSKPLSLEDILILAEHARRFQFSFEEIALRQEYLKRAQLESNERMKLISKIAKAYHNIKMSKAAGKILSPFLLTEYKLIKPRLMKYDSEARHQISSTDTMDVRRTPSTTDRLCQGQTKTSKEQSELYCTHRRTEIPYYVVKEEVLHVRPRVSLFHDIISDDDIKTLKKTSIQQLYKPSETPFTEAGMTIYQLNDRKFKKLSDKLSRRMTLITGLSTRLKPIQTDADNFQVIHYGPGGRLPEISDCRTDTLWDSSEHDQLPLAPYVRYSGDNIATWITFLNDVKKGGATIMPALKVRVPPVKGAALFFYNYKRSGVCDLRTSYRTCPVALGTRWDAVKLIKQGGQVLRRLCDTSMDSKDD